MQSGMPRQVLQQGARDLEPAFGRLIRIGGRANGNALAGADLLQLLAKQPSGMLLYVNPALKVHAVTHLHELMGVTRIAVFAAKLAAAIRIDGPAERHAL